MGLASGLEDRKEETVNSDKLHDPAAEWSTVAEIIIDGIKESLQRKRVVVMSEDDSRRWLSLFFV